MYYLYELSPWLHAKFGMDTANIMSVNWNIEFLYRLATLFHEIENVETLLGSLSTYVPKMAWIGSVVKA